MKKSDARVRRELLKQGLFAAGAALLAEGTALGRAEADEKTPAAEPETPGGSDLLLGLDGMSRVTDPGNHPFLDGHRAAAVMASVFFCREQKLDEPTQVEIRKIVKARLLKSAIYQPRPKEAADPALVEGLVKDLDAGIDVLRQSGHNIIFANLALKALRDMPEAATPERVAGLRRMVQGFGSRGGGPRVQRDRSFVDLSDETKFVHFVFEEFLKAIDLYAVGKGYHGFAGHLLTAGQALLELHRGGHAEMADKGLRAYWEFVQGARDGAAQGGGNVPKPPAAPTPIDRDYWLAQEMRPTGEIVSCHLIKYPYSLFALAKELRDEELKQRIREKLPYLTAVS